MSLQWLYQLSETLGIVKLHPLSVRAYKLETAGVSLMEAATALMAVNDPSFPGYPYGLVEADFLARITHREQRAMIELLRTRLGNAWQSHSGALDSHSILDSLSGTSN